MAALNQGRSIAAHMLSFSEEPLKTLCARASAKPSHCARTGSIQLETNAMRLINAEGDGIPGPDRRPYDGIFVMQISHAALESIKPLLMQLLVEEASPRGIYEKSTSFLRKKEGMQEVQPSPMGRGVFKPGDLRKWASVSGSIWKKDRKPGGFSTKGKCEG